MLLISHKGTKELSYQCDKDTKAPSLIGIASLSLYGFVANMFHFFVSSWQMCFKKIS